ncbi:UNVERIFIED_CONTAM: hypothetical protein GTU68_050233 [Idotea baltica]|nr:hypothetical protein [Idotea baltica]
MLTQTLRRLEEDGMVHRKVLVEMRPPRVEYSLTDLGQTITEPLEAIRHWTEQHLPDVRRARAEFARVSEVSCDEMPPGGHPSRPAGA